MLEGPSRKKWQCQLVIVFQEALFVLPARQGMQQSGGCKVGPLPSEGSSADTPRYIGSEAPRPRR